jgi:hypothetical protein
MTDTAPNPKRRRRRWLAVGLLLIAGLVAWRFTAAQSLVSRGRQIRVGQSRSEVIALMGNPHMSYNSGTVSGEYYSSRLGAELLVRVLLHNFLDVDVIPQPSEMDVEVRYDDQQRVSSVRVGRQ